MENGMEPRGVKIIADASQLDECRRLLSHETVIALDCEGIDLSRFGTIALVQIGLWDGRCLLFDVLNAVASSAVVCFLRHLLEHRGVLKIIHDCRMDSDALHHLLGIQLQGIHDTQFWSGEELSLNAALVKYGLPLNEARDKSVYQRNPAYWGTRPLTREMVQWACEDIRSLTGLYRTQAMHLGPESQLYQTQHDARLAVIRDGVAEIISVNPELVGLFIGPKGAKINDVKARTGAMFQRLAGTYCWMVFAPDADALQHAKWAMHRCLVPPDPR
eukprot:GGOE01055232.1.p1 GENE.GGOE01055232.1~~GGOE01055232.1.p1  ORF type:complete len:274 (-),score=90.87 GGOE01055232.1:184-1005(-)